MNEHDLVLYPARSRRIMACGLMALVALMLIWSAIVDPISDMSSRALRVGFGALAAWAAFELWRITSHGLVLSLDALKDTDGTELVKLSDIKSVQRGVFALKPSHGMLVKAHVKVSGRWRPGLYWRYGRTLGIGGMTPKATTKAFADALEMRVSSAH